MSDTLVAYFSASGTTERVARRIAEALGADLFEIAPEAPYTSADLNWHDSQSRSSVEMADPASRPALTGTFPDMSGYRRLILGFPIWWGVAPRPVNTFLDSVDWSKTEVVLFATSGSSGIDEAREALSATYPAMKIKAAKLLNAGNPAAWARSL